MMASPGRKAHCHSNPEAVTHWGYPQRCGEAHGAPSSQGSHGGTGCLGGHPMARQQHCSPSAAEALLQPARLFGCPVLLNTHLAPAMLRRTEVASGPREVACHRGCAGEQGGCSIAGASDEFNRGRRQGGSKLEKRRKKGEAQAA